ncbi:MAG TPA: ECF transporter S component [Candidatus Merdibacter merdavium]|uniref:ECF transporter S component n=1 Tax=Candidatus Merdibacter merdavium TaxID=2838692 RepID=A0A9D2NSY3_9FIRM|nr:ECF transporter S component [Candidatus Merdibacter merdavium]
MRNRKTTNMVIFAMLLAVEVVMSFTPLGFLRIGLLSVTMLHIPVIICAMALGKKYGAALGFVMGFCSFYNATFSPTITSFCFTPFFSMGGVEGSWTSLLIAFLPRIALGYGAGAIYERLKGKNGRTAAALSGLSGALINTIGVLGGIWIFFKEPYEAVLGNTIVALLMTTVGINSIAEAVVGVIAAMAVHSVLKHRNLS